MSGTSEHSLQCSAFVCKTLILIFALIFPLCPAFASQTSESATSSKAFNSIPSSDFTITATLPSSVPADGSTSATSTIIVNPISSFTGTVVLSDAPLPAGIICRAIDPVSIPNGLGTAILACTSTVAGTYAVTISGISGRISHNTTQTFTFAASLPPDFTIVNVSTVSFNSGSTATSYVTVIPQGGFDSQVNLTVTVYPSTGLSVSLTPQTLAHGSGTATATFSAPAVGDFTVTIAGTSKSLSHTTTIVILVTLTLVPDFEISASPSSMYLQAGNPGITRIIVDAENGFTGLVALVVAAPGGISCSLIPTRLESSGTSILTCNSSTAGEYVIMIRATAQASPHNTTVDVHVAALSPAAPASSTILGLAPAIVYGIIGAIIAVVVAGTVLILRRSSRARHE